MKKAISLSLALLCSLLIFVAAPGAQEGRRLNVTGGGLCQNSLSSLLRDEINRLRPEETLTVVIETENKGLVRGAIAMEEFPVVFEEKEAGNDLTTFLLRLK